MKTYKGCQKCHGNGYFVIDRDGGDDVPCYYCDDYRQRDLLRVKPVSYMVGSRQHGADARMHAVVRNWINNQHAFCEASPVYSSSWKILHDEPITCQECINALKERLSLKIETWPAQRGDIETNLENTWSYDNGVSKRLWKIKCPACATSEIRDEGYCNEGFWVTCKNKNCSHRLFVRRQ